MGLRSQCNIRYTLGHGLFRCLLLWGAFVITIVYPLELVAQRPLETCERVFVHTLEDFRAHTQNHIRRIVVLGTELLQKHSEDFPGIDPVLLAEFLTLHDQSKVNRSRDFLERYGLDGRDTSIQEELWNFFGRWDALSGEDQTRVQDLKKDLNAVDHAVALDFFGRRNLLQEDGALSPVAHNYLRLERIVDSVDTVLAPARAEEFGKVFGIENMYLKAPEDRALAYELEHFYFERANNGTDPLFFKPILPPSWERGVSE